MTNAPIALTHEEKQEIAAMDDVRDCWGAETPEEFIELLDHTIYAVKFNFNSASPGYCGDLITMYGDALQLPLVLVRLNGKLQITTLG